MARNRKPTLAEKLRDPALRATLPDSALTPELLRKRRRNRRLNAPFVPGSDMTYGDVARERKAATQLAYGPVESQLLQRQTNIPHWFDQYKQDLAAKQTAQRERYQQAVAGVTAQGAATQEASNAERARIDAEMRADAASRGATYSGTPGQEAAAGTDVRKALVDAFAAALTSQGQAYDDFTAGQGTVASAAQLTETLRGQRALEDLEREKGAFGVDWTSKRRDQLHTQTLEDLMFKLNLGKFAESTKKKPLSPSERKTQAELEYFEDHGYFPSTGAPKTDKPGGGKPRFTPLQTREANADLRKAIRLVESKYIDSPSYLDDAFDALVDSRGFDPAIARAAIQLVSKGRLGPKTARTLWNDYGLKPKKRLRRKPAKPMEPNTINNADPHFGGEG